MDKRTRANRPPALSTQVEEQASPVWERLVLQCGSDANSTAKSYSTNTSAAEEVLGGQQVTLYQGNRAIGRLVQPKVELEGHCAVLAFDCWSPVTAGSKRGGGLVQHLALPVDEAFSASSFSLACGRQLGGLRFSFSGRETAAALSIHQQRLEYIKKQQQRFSGENAGSQSSSSPATHESFTVHTGSEWEQCSLTFNTRDQAPWLQRVALKLVVIQPGPVDETEERPRQASTGLPSRSSGHAEPQVVAEAASPMASSSAELVPQSTQHRGGAKHVQGGEQSPEGQQQHLSSSGGTLGPAGGHGVFTTTGLDSTHAPNGPRCSDAAPAIAGGAATQLDSHPSASTGKSSPTAGDGDGDRDGISDERERADQAPSKGGRRRSSSGLSNAVAGSPGTGQGREGGIEDQQSDGKASERKVQQGSKLDANAAPFDVASAAALLHPKQAPCTEAGTGTGSEAAVEQTAETASEGPESSDKHEGQCAGPLSASSGLSKPTVRLIPQPPTAEESARGEPSGAGSEPHGDIAAAAATTGRDKACGGNCCGAEPGSAVNTSQAASGQSRAAKGRGASSGSGADVAQPAAASAPDGSTEAAELPPPSLLQPQQGAKPGSTDAGRQSVAQSAHAAVAPEPPADANHVDVGPGEGGAQAAAHTQSKVEHGGALHPLPVRRQEPAAKGSCVEVANGPVGKRGGSSSSKHADAHGDADPGTPTLQPQQQPGRAGSQQQQPNGTAHGSGFAKAQQPSSPAASPSAVAQEPAAPYCLPLPNGKSLPRNGELDAAAQLSQTQQQMLMSLGMLQGQGPHQHPLHGHGHGQGLSPSTPAHPQPQPQPALTPPSPILPPMVMPGMPGLPGGLPGMHPQANGGMEAVLLHQFALAQQQAGALAQQQLHAAVGSPAHAQQQQYAAAAASAWQHVQQQQHPAAAGMQQQHEQAFQRMMQHHMMQQQQQQQQQQALQQQREEGVGTPAVRASEDSRSQASSEASAPDSASAAAAAAAAAALEEAWETGSASSVRSEPAAPTTSRLANVSGGSVGGGVMALSPPEQQQRPMGPQHRVQSHGNMLVAASAAAGGSGGGGGGGRDSRGNAGGGFRQRTSFNGYGGPGGGGGGGGGGPGPAGGAQGGGGPQGSGSSQATSPPNGGNSGGPYNNRSSYGAGGPPQRQPGGPHAFGRGGGGRYDGGSSGDGPRPGSRGAHMQGGGGGGGGHAGHSRHGGGGGGHSSHHHGRDAEPYPPPPEALPLPDPKGSCDLDRFISQIEPVIAIDPAKPPQQALQDLRLRDLWNFYFEPSLYGREVFTQGGHRGASNSYFVPYLSAIQIFASALPTDVGGTSRLYVSEDNNGWPRHMHLKFEYFEHELPFNRLPLYDQIELLSGTLAANAGAPSTSRGGPQPAPAAAGQSPTPPAAAPATAADAGTAPTAPEGAAAAAAEAAKAPASLTTPASEEDNSASADGEHQQQQDGDGATAPTGDGVEAATGAAGSPPKAAADGSAATGSTAASSTAASAAAPCSSTTSTPASSTASSSAAPSASGPATPANAPTAPTASPSSGPTGRLLYDMRLVDVHPASWFAVAWYPVYRIPDAPLYARFLTFHSFAPLVTSMQNAHERLQMGQVAPYMLLSLPVVGLIWYNMQGERWMEPLDESSSHTGGPGGYGGPGPVNSPRGPQGGRGGGGRHGGTDVLYQNFLHSLQGNADRLARGLGLRMLGQHGLEEVRLRVPDYEFFRARS